MIYSVWRPDGGYDYYETSNRHAIGDDLPDMSVPSEVNGVGVPAQDVGRPLPPGAKRVGAGTAPVGVMSPMDRPSNLGLSGGLFDGGTMPAWLPYSILGLCVLGGAYFLKRGKHG